MRKTGLALAGVAGALWVLFGALFLGTGDDEGANIGAGLVGLLAVPASAASLVLLLVSVRRAPTAPGRAGLAARVGTTLAVLSLVLFAAFWALGPSADTTAMASALTITLAVAVVTFLAAAALFLPWGSGRS